MNVQALRQFLLYCTLLNYTLLIIWFLVAVVARGWFHGLWGKWFHVSSEQFDLINFTGIVFYKAGVLLFNLIPWIALVIIGMRQ